MDRAAFSTLRPPRPTVAGVLAMAAAAGVIAWLVVADERGSAPAAAPAPAAAGPSVPASPVPAVGPVLLTQRALEARVRSFGQPVFWAGPQPGRRYELTRTTDGAVLIRYLPKGAKAGASENRLLMIGTYPFEDAYQTAKTAIKNSPASRYLELPSGGLAVYDPERATSVYLAYPKVDYQVEVYDPSPEVARQVAGSGEVRPVP